MTPQKINSPRLFNYFFILVSVAVFVIVAMRSALIPFSHDEAATFFYFIQEGSFLPYISHNDANNHILNSCLSWICYKFFGDSPFSLRLPNLLALIVLVFAVYRISKQLTHTHSKLILAAGFLLSFHWLSFYSLCRAYGISMSCLILGISYLIDYFNSREFKKLFLFYLFIQLALSAHLILVIIAIGFTLPILLFQILNKQLLNKWNLVVLLTHALLLLFWVKYSFFLQNSNLLYGDEQHYWTTTFISLFQLLSGSTRTWIPVIFVSGFLGLIIAAVSVNYKRVKTNFQNLFHPSLFYTLMLAGMIVAFYLMHILFNINYPEDRYGLFFYVFFVIALVFTTDLFTGKAVKELTALILLGAIVHFIYYLNFRKHSLSCYETMPERFYTRLLQEQKLSAEKITISGQTETELIYNFFNYRHNGALALIDVSPNGMQMNSDYVVAWGKKEPYYEPYYTKIDSEPDWGLSLLKRREKITRTLLISDDTVRPIKGANEFYNLCVIKDSSNNNTNPLLVEFNIGHIEAAMPVQSWLVLSIDSSGGHQLYYERIPLNWVKYDWSTSNNPALYLATGPLPPKKYKLTCYLWNLEKKEIKVNMNSIKIYRLDGKNVNVVAHFHPSKKL